MDFGCKSSFVVDVDLAVLGSSSFFCIERVPLRLNFLLTDAIKKTQ
jgi:hypothetical protein